MNSEDLVRSSMDVECGTVLCWSGGLPVAVFIDYGIYLSPNFWAEELLGIGCFPQDPIQNYESF